jgi:hypothetical protein
MSRGWGHVGVVLVFAVVLLCVPCAGTWWYASDAGALMVFVSMVALFTVPLVACYGLAYFALTRMSTELRARGWWLASAQIAAGAAGFFVWLWVMNTGPNRTVSDTTATVIAIALALLAASYVAFRRPHGLALTLAAVVPPLALGFATSMLGSWSYNRAETFVQGRLNGEMGLGAIIPAAAMMLAMLVTAVAGGVLCALPALIAGVVDGGRATQVGGDGGVVA